MISYIISTKNVIFAFFFFQILMQITIAVKQFKFVPFIQGKSFLHILETNYVSLE